MTDTRLATMKRRIDTRLNNVLCEMKPEYDDSIHGFNEAWTIVNEAFAEASLVPPDTEGEAQPVAWRWRPKGATLWRYDPEPEWIADQDRDDIDLEPLYAAPPQVEPAEGEALNIANAWFNWIVGASDDMDLPEGADKEGAIRSLAEQLDVIRSALAATSQSAELLSLTEALKSIAEFSSGDETTLGALRRLVEVRAIAIRALEKSGR